MKAEIFTLADSVHMFEGKLVIVGTFDTIKSAEFPFVFRPFGIAVKLTVNKSEYDKPFELNVVIRKGKETVVNLPLTATFNVLRKRGRLSYHAALNLMGAQFKSTGVYSVELKKAKRIIRSTELNVFRLVKVKKKKKKRPRRPGGNS